MCMLCCSVALAVLAITQGPQLRLRDTREIRCQDPLRPRSYNDNDSINSNNDDNKELPICIYIYIYIYICVHDLTWHMLYVWTPPEECLQAAQRGGPRRACGRRRGALLAKAPLGRLCAPKAGLRDAPEGFEGVPGEDQEVQDGAEGCEGADAPAGATRRFPP